MPTDSQCGKPPEALYLDLLKKCLTRSIFGERSVVRPNDQRARALLALVRKAFAPLDIEVVARVPVDPDTRAEGGDWPLEAESMVGLRRLDNLQFCIEDVVRRSVPGDLIETGVWRGGASIFMRAVLQVYGDTSRTVWVADSFQGLPPPNPEKYPSDEGQDFTIYPELSVPLEVVKANFERYGLLDDQVRFLVGWFRDTLPSAPIDQLAILRLDGDLYESTMDALYSLYPKLSIGGYIIIDDYNSVPACTEAVRDFRATHGIKEPIVATGRWGGFWQRTA
jgi:O-methyltransferase